MHVETEGAPDAPPLVLLHGGAGAGRYHWSRLVAPLAEMFRVYLPDLPGHGHTPLRPDEEYSRDLVVGAVADLLDQFDRPVHVGGFSMGGHTALALAAERPAGFASLVLIGVSIRNHPGLDRWRAGFDPDRLEARYPLWAKSLSRLHTPLGGAQAWRAVLQRDAGGLRLDADLTALEAVRCPVLLVRGDRDPAVDPEHYSELRARWPHAEEFVVPGGSHDVQLTRHRVVRPVLIDFYTRLPAAGADQ